ncbi:Uncharacterized protein family UPF0016 [Musa troglodytarum]|uniref:GDT1 family protein n=1 Tax=Musa troglodytarum TaxID=320322 RepID=A0A9E7FVW6_9LILI|nr:Uncharacterized protein family UPF0016 [Musa troglodytarum]
MGLSLIEGFTKSLAMTVLSEIGDKTFFAAAISRKWSHHVTTVLFFGFGLCESEELAEVEAKLNADWKAETGSNKGNTKGSDDLKKRQRPFLTHFFSPIFLKAFSITFFGEWGDKSQIATIGLASDENPVGVVLGGIVYGLYPLQTSSVFASLFWFSGQALCTTAAVIGGKSLASQISEKMVALSSGILFLVFGLQSFLAAAGES